MKHLFIFSIALSIFLFSCSKSKDDAPKGPTNEEILNKKIEDIIPQKYLDTLKRLGLQVNMGVTPPNVEGTYKIKPYILDTSNIASDRPGTAFLDAILHLSGQHTSDYSIKLIGEYFISQRDTSVVTAISGSGNNFTVYGKVKTYYGNNSAIFAMIMTATKEGDHLKNFKIGIINVDNSNGGGLFIAEGQGRIAHDKDGISEKIAAKAAPESLNRDARHNFPGGIFVP